jgi:hypothetical protein
MDGSAVDKPQDLFVLTVDVECDSDGGPTWRYSDPLGFAGVDHGLGQVLVPMLQRVEAVATLLVSNVVLEDNRSVDILRQLPNVERGAHLHGDFLRPEARALDPAGEKARENQHEYSESVERSKLEALATLFRDAFGHDPRSFRAGRWSASGRTARLLSELGYVADSSVSPHVHWSDGGRSVDYRQAPDQPYRPSADDLCRPGELPLWELPVSITREWWRRPRRTWLRPSLSTAAAMQRVIRSIRRRYPAPRTFVAMIHNNELTPGASPYSRDPEAAALVGRRLEGLLCWARDEGMRFATLTEAAKSCAVTGTGSQDGSGR